MAKHWTIGTQMTIIVVTVEIEMGGVRYVPGTVSPVLKERPVKGEANLRAVLLTPWGVINFVQRRKMV